MVEERSRGVIFFLFYFLSLFQQSSKFPSNSRRSSRERVQTWTKTGEIQETRSQLSPNNPIIGSESGLSDYRYYGCVSLTSFLHVYLSIFFFFYLDFHITLEFFFFFLSLGSTILECSVFVWGSKTAARVDSRGSCSTACQQSGVRVIRKRHITLTT